MRFLSSTKLRSTDADDAGSASQPHLISILSSRPGKPQKGFLEKIGFKTSAQGSKRSTIEPLDLRAKKTELFPDERYISSPSPINTEPVIYGDDQSSFDDFYQLELMLRHIYKRSRANGWFTECREDGAIRVALRTTASTDEYEANYLTAPHVDHYDDEEAQFVSLLDLAGFLNCEVLVSITNRVTSTLLRHLPPSVKTIILDASTQIQVIDSIDEFMSLRRAQGAAFIRDDESLLVWSEQVNTILATGRALEEKMVNLIWDEKSKLSQSFGHANHELEDGSLPESKRSVSFITPTSVAISFMAIAAFLGQDLHEVILQIKADNNYMAVCILLYFPIMIWLSSFFAQTFSVIVLQLLGPVSQLTTNSKFYSGAPPRQNPELNLPHITVQCPVYKEDLETVLIPALESVKEAIKTYEMQGGTANIFINDDGIQIINTSDRKKRIAFYARNKIGWIARPAGGHDGFIRHGRFKKASNMNYAMNLSYELELQLEKLDRAGQWSDTHESAATQAFLQEILEAQQPPAMGGGDVRIGDIILIIDADTRIPADCFLDAANEFHNCPEVAILQHTSLAFQVVHNYWEDCMAYFTLFVSEAMKFMTAGGDVAPFVGHNAFLRWSAIQELEYKSLHDDGQRRWWSETHVSEDFELSMKLQDLGYCVRMAGYSGGEFKEGVSLTVYDEINRWQKYAYGISELCFNPLRYWIIRSPFTPLFRRFLRSKRISGASKFTMIAYMASYYAIASLWFLAVINYFLLGWFSVLVTELYQTSFQILIATLIVFDVSVPVVNAIYRYRTRQAPLFFAFYENFKYIMLLCLFFGGISIHITQSLIWHLLGLQMHWDSTAKSLEASYFVKELPMIWRKYKVLYIGLLLLTVILIVLAAPAVPQTWRIVPSVFTGFPIGWVIACHALSPLILNPQSWLSELHL